MKRKSTAIWNGTGKEGKGTLTSTSGVLQNTPYSFATRFMSEDGKAGTNPEELIAAAHAGCFSMALSFQLTGEGFPPTELKTEAILSLENENGGFVIKSIHLGACDFRGVFSGFCPAADFTWIFSDGERVSKRF